ncbi:unnamed protein product, partial [Amoebophrya sp. A25]
VQLFTGAAQEPHEDKGVKTRPMEIEMLARRHQQEMDCHYPQLRPSGGGGGTTT